MAAGQRTQGWGKEKGGGAGAFTGMWGYWAAMLSHPSDAQAPAMPSHLLQYPEQGLQCSQPHRTLRRPRCEQRVCRGPGVPLWLGSRLHRVSGCGLSSPGIPGTAPASGLMALKPTRGSQERVGRQSRLPHVSPVCTHSEGRPGRRVSGTPQNKGSAAPGSHTLLSQRPSLFSIQVPKSCRPSPAASQ